jgi:hypothetical protein
MGRWAHWALGWGTKTSRNMLFWDDLQYRYSVCCKKNIQTCMYIVYIYEIFVIKFGYPTQYPWIPVGPPLGVLFSKQGATGVPFPCLLSWIHKWMSSMISLCGWTFFYWTIFVPIVNYLFINTNWVDYYFSRQTTKWKKNEHVHSHQVHGHGQFNGSKILEVQKSVYWIRTKL